MLTIIPGMEPDKDIGVINAMVGVAQAPDGKWYSWIEATGFVDDPSRVVKMRTKPFATRDEANARCDEVARFWQEQYAAINIQRVGDA